MNIFQRLFKRTVGFVLLIGLFSAGGAIAAPGVPASVKEGIDLLTETLALPVCDSLKALSPSNPAWIAMDETVNYRWMGEPLGTANREVVVFNVGLREYGLMEMYLEGFTDYSEPAARGAFFGWMGKLSTFEAQRDALQADTTRGIATFDLSLFYNYPGTYNWIVVFYNANEKAMCRSTNYWLDVRGFINQQQTANTTNIVISAPPKTSTSTQTDTDGDGFNDNVDACPLIPGVAPNGCPPIPDTDGDGFNDNVDSCPLVPGVAPNGCPPADTDGDGIIDSADACPTTPGTPPDGCPDTDGDGFKDHVDVCPTTPGTAPDGCPDTDGDGFKDHVDACPLQPGTVPDGCPDTDGDGFKDAVDTCPTLPGTAPDGCPDTDGDGFKDHVDACPLVPGVAPDGCPPPAPNDTDGDGFNDNVDACPLVPGTARNRP